MPAKNERLVSNIQKLLRRYRIPAWLFYDFHELEPLALRILQFPPRHHATRRWFYLVPAQGEPRKLVHRIESGNLDHLPGRKTVYLRWEELHSGLQGLLEGLVSVAMQYSEKNSIPYVSRVDAGTVELVRSCGAEVISSGDLIQHLEAAWTPRQVHQHREAARILTTIMKQAFQQAAGEIREKGRTSERAIQEFILDRLEEEDLTTDSPPIVAANQNSANPHHQPGERRSDPISRSDFLLIDVWARVREEGSVFADITWNGYFGETVPEPIQSVFKVVRSARDRGVRFLQHRHAGGRLPQGWEVDDAVRGVIRKAGYEDLFVHRTGHNLGQAVHGNGVNFDNLETHDTRQVIGGIGCTIEPGIYLREFGIRSEIDVYISREGVEVTTPPQKSVLLMQV